jgi:hypothetical protein
MEEKIISLFKRIYPLDAFLQGYEDCKDVLFIPSSDAKKSLISEIDSLTGKTETEKILLKSFKAELELYEAPTFVSHVSYALFCYTLKSADTANLISIATEGIRVLLKEYTDLPVGVRALTALAIQDLQSALPKYDSHSELHNLLQDYYNRIKPSFSLDRRLIMDALSVNAFNRKAIYRRYLVEMYDIHEAPSLIEDKSYAWFVDTLIKFQEIRERAARNHDLNINDIDIYLFRLTPRDIHSLAVDYRKQIITAAREYLIDIPENHRVEIVKTPHYLISQIPVAAAQSIDIINGSFQNALFITKEALINRFFLIDVLVHEELGHNLNFTLSQKAPVIDKLFFTRPSFATGEILATSIEWQFYKLMQNITVFKEADFQVLYSYVFMKRMLFVYIRSLADIRINTEQQTIKEFLLWVEKKTGFHPDELFPQIFSRQMQPGYLTTYPLGFHSLENIRKRSALTQKEFNSFAWSKGLPPKSVFEKLVKGHEKR